MSRSGPDGLSTMPDYGEAMTVRRLVDLVADLRSLKDTCGTSMDMKGHDMK